MSADEPFRRGPAIVRRTPRDNAFQPHASLGAGAEFDAIRRMLERWGPRARRIGDDAAVITTLGDRALVVSTDTSVENVHFRRGWLTPEEIGYRATAAALSDLAAMGAKPLGLLAAIALPEEWRSKLDALGDGIGEAAELADAPILGGDMSRASELSLTITVLGTARDVMYRTTARAGDSVYVTGSLGGPLAALQDLEEGRLPAPAERQRFARPVPRIHEAAWLSRHGARAAIDISDGLAADLAHLAAASRVSITIDMESVPRFGGATADDAMRSGEEYELIVTSPVVIESHAFRECFGLDLTRIGSVEKGSGEVRFMAGGGQVEIASGYLHFDP